MRQAYDGSQGIAFAAAHPGHELRLAGWIARSRPVVFILTSGSRSGASRQRVEASYRLAEELGARPGSLFGRHLDREVYDWILRGDHLPFAGLAEELAEAFVRQRIRTVVADSWQLYNAVHDVWHVTVRLAAEMASARLGAPLACLDYPVVPPGRMAPAPGPERMVVNLSSEEARRKLALADSFPEIGDEVVEVLKADPDGLGRESLHEPPPIADLRPPPGAKPAYEAYGETRVAAGLYRSVLRWRHVEPIVARLAERLRLVAEPC